jgi:ABC-2 type transport system ATP-binding protein
MGAPAAIAVENLKKTYRGWWGAQHEALRGLTLRIEPGVAFGLIGPNGAGKTTFIKLLLNVARPTSGTVSVLGGDPEDVSIRARIGYLPERMHLPAALSGLDFLKSVATLKQLRLPLTDLHGLLERVGLQVSAQRVGTYSKGMRQRLGLAAAMLGRPELLILDEPTDGIDPVGRVEVRALLVEEKQRGATILLNSHLLAETERVCDRIGVLEAGMLRLEGALSEVRAAANRWRARFAAGGADQVLLESGFVRDGDAWSFAGDDVAALNAALERARVGGAMLIELMPATRDLEQVLTEALS